MKYNSNRSFLLNIMNRLHQGKTNPGRQVTMAPKIHGGALYLW
jgi:hypothetical protein